MTEHGRFALGKDREFDFWEGFHRGQGFGRTP